MPSITTLNQALHDFTIGVLDHSPMTIAITGKWGTGKTHLWNTFVEKNSSIIKQNFEAYSYISLFGISSISDLKSKIFINASIFKEDDEVEIQQTKTMIPQALRFTKGKRSKELAERTKTFFNKNRGAQLLSKFAHFGKDLPILKNFSTYIESSEYWLVDAFLICIDDFERKSPNITSRDILGLIDELSTTKNCKVVLIFNDEYLSEDDEYKLFREKVIDLELQYTPRYSECANIAYANNKNTQHIAKETATTISCANIRVLKKSAWCANSIINSIDRNSNENIYDQLSQIITKKSIMISDIIFNRHANINIERIEAAWHAIYMNDESANSGEGLQKTITELNITPNEVDRIIFDFFKNGVVDNAKLEKVLQQEREMQINSQKTNDLHEPWRYYHTTFNDTSNEFLECLLGAYNKYKDDLSIFEISDILGGFDIVGYDYSTIIDEYVKNLDIQTAHDILDDRLLISRVNSNLLNKIKETFPNKPTTSLDIAIDNVYTSDGITSISIATLESATYADYLKWFESNPQHMIDKIRKILNISNWTHIHKPLLLALDHIKNSNTFNKKRVEKMLGRFIPSE